jgi:hypothetical protein
MSLIILAKPDVKIEQSLIESTLGSVTLREEGKTISGQVLAINESAVVNLKGEFWVFDYCNACEWKKVSF